MTEKIKLACGCEIPVVDGAPQIDYDEINLECPLAWTLYHNGHTQSVFQLEKYLGKEWSRRCKPSNIIDAAALIAAIRPGSLNSENEDGESMTEAYSLSKNGKKKIDLNPALEPILGESHGVMLFQEQLMKICTDICGFTGAESNKMRKGVGKKDADLINSLESMFLEGAKSKGIISEDEAKSIFEQIRASARYSFNKSHSVGYAITGYWTAWVKAHLPLHYVCAWLRFAHTEQKPLEEISKLIVEARRLQIDVWGPSVKNLPNVDFFIKNDGVYFGINSIKGCGKTAVSKLPNNLEDLSWIEFLILHGHKVAKNKMLNMIRVGAFDFMGEQRSKIEFDYEIVCQLTKSELEKARSIFNSDSTLSLSEILSELVEQCTSKRKEIVEDLVESLAYPPRSLEDSKENIIAHEKELLGISLSFSKLETAKMPEFVNKSTEIPGIPKKEEVLVAGQVCNFRQIKTRTGLDMAFFEIEDDKGTCEAVIFSEKMYMYQASLYDGNIILVKGVKSDRKNSFIVNKIFSI